MSQQRTIGRYRQDGLWSELGAESSRPWVRWPG